MKKFKNTCVFILAVCCSQFVTAQKTGTIGKYSYPIHGSETGKAYGSNNFYMAYATDGAYSIFYARFDKDSLFATKENYKANGTLEDVYTYRVNYKHQNVKIANEDYLSSHKLYKVSLKNLNNDYSMYLKWLYSPSVSMDQNSSYLSLDLMFNSKEAADKFYNDLKNGAPAETKVQTSTASQTTPVQETKTEVKVTLKNKGNDKIEMFYQKTVASRDLTSLTLPQSQSKEITLEAGCEVYYKVNGSKGALILKVTSAMNGTTQVVKQ